MRKSMRDGWHSMAINEAAARVAASGGAPAMPPTPGARGQEPLSFTIAAIMLAAHFGEGFVSALNDALRSDIDPRAGRHLAVHHQALFIELVEIIPIAPVRHEIGIGDEHAGRILVGL